MSNFIQDYYKSASTRPSYIAAGVSLDLAKNIEKLMADQNISNSTLAEKLECSKSYVTKLLRGDANLTIKTLAKVAIALDAEIKTALIAKSDYKELQRQLTAYIQQLNKQRSDDNKRKSWVTDAIGSNDETFGYYRNFSTELENANARTA